MIGQAGNRMVAIVQVAAEVNSSKAGLTCNAGNCSPNDWPESPNRGRRGWFGKVAVREDRSL